MVRNLTGVVGEFETDDASDAVAVAICHAVLRGTVVKTSSVKSSILKAAAR
jgi:Holliday junction resolvasome RuvABC endonuclease subunit